MVRKLTPVLVVERIEPCLRLWIDGLGFEKGPEVMEPDGKALGFVILQRGAVEVMYQSRASVAADIPALAKTAGATTLYVEVDDLARVRAAIAGLPVVVPERTTFYGAREIGVREPGGHVVLFAQFTAPPPA